MPINKQYRKQIEQITLDNEANANKDMKEVYKEQKKSLDTIEVMLGALFIKYSVKGFLKMTQKEKNSTGYKTLLTGIGKDLGNSEVKIMTDILINSYKDTYYKQAFLLDDGLKIDLKFNILKDEFIQSAINQKFEGDMFSDRIWKHKAELINKLKDGLENTMKGNTTIDKVAQDLKKSFNTTAYQSQLLVNNEMAKLQSQASIEIAINTGIKKHQWSATLDTSTEPEDGALDGETFDIDDSSAPTIPLHVGCRCVWINIPYEGWKASNRKDNITKEVIDYTTYSEWAKAKGINKTKS